MGGHVVLNFVVHYFPEHERYVVYVKRKAYSFKTVDEAVDFLLRCYKLKGEVDVYGR